MMGEYGHREETSRVVNRRKKGEKRRENKRTQEGQCEKGENT